MIEYYQHFLSISPCVQKCKHCYIPDWQKIKLLPKQKIFNEVDQLKKLKDQGIMENIRFYFHEEPTSHPDIFEILKYIKANDMTYNNNLATNGFGFFHKYDKDKLMMEFIKSGIKSIQIAFFGEEDYHDKFTGREGSFKDICEMINLAKSYNLQIILYIFLFKNNLEQAIFLHNKYKDLVKGFAIFTSGSNVKRHQDLIITKDWYELHKNELVNHVKDRLYIYDQISQMYEEWIKDSKNDIKIGKIDLYYESYFTNHDNNYITDGGCYLSNESQKYTSIGDTSKESILEIFSKPRLSYYSFTTRGPKAGLISLKEKLKLMQRMHSEFILNNGNEMLNIWNMYHKVFDYALKNNSDYYLNFLKEKLKKNDFWTLVEDDNAVYIVGKSWDICS